MVYRHLLTEGYSGIEDATDFTNQDRLDDFRTVLAVVTCQKEASCRRIEAIQDLAMYHNEAIEHVRDPKGHFSAIIDSLFPKEDPKSEFFNGLLYKQMPGIWNADSIQNFTQLIGDHFKAHINSRTNARSKEEKIINFFKQEVPKSVQLMEETNVIIRKMIDDLEIEDKDRQASLARNKAIFRATYRAEQ